MTAQSDYLEKLAAWKVKRLKALKAADGWLNIVGRWELDAQSATIGAGEGNDFVVPTGPDRLGTVIRNTDGTITFAPVAGEPVTVAPNKKAPPRFTVGRFLMEVTTLNGQNALRVRDTQSTAPDALAGIDYFPPQPEWRIVADWKRLDTAQGLTIGTTGAIETEVEVTHKASFTHDGQTYELIATHGTPEAPQFVIRDLTSRDLTYPASRFVYGEEVTDSTIVLDFNKAINPPCSFTEFAVCPLPPPQNVLPFRIEAGEKRPAGH